jgi:hypothetical protein
VSDLCRITEGIFAEFCEAIGIAHLKDYEEKMLVEARVRRSPSTATQTQQDQAKKRTEYTRQISALKSQLEYEASRDTKSQSALALPE